MEEGAINGVDAKSAVAVIERNGIDRRFVFESDGELEVEPNFRPPKIKLKFSIPRAIITHPSHIPTMKGFDSFEEFLDHDDISKNKELLAAAEEEAREEALIRNKIEDAVINGPLRPDCCSLSLPEKVPEPPQQYAHQDHLVAHALYLQRLLMRERKDHMEIMKKRNALVMAEIKRRRPLTREEVEQEQLLENKRIYKEQVSQLRRKWEEVLKVSLIISSLCSLPDGSILLCCNSSD
jgi:helicase SWR1